MAEDVLARFEDPSRRGQGAPATVEPVAASSKPEYVAFETKDKILCFDIERAPPNLWRHPLLKHYLDVAHRPPNERVLTIFFTYMSIRVIGRNLGQLADAIRLGKCTCIREYSAEVFAGPPAEGETFIEKIELIVRPLHEAMDESEQQGQ